jgi:hypothetical protein
VVPEREQADQDRAVIRRGHLVAVVVRALLIGCAVLLVVGCAGARSEAPQEEEQGSSPPATDSEEVRCEGTRTIKNPFLHDEAAANDRFRYKGSLITNDLRGCPNGGLLLGTDKRDKLGGLEGDDEIRGLGGKDEIYGDNGNDVIYAGPGEGSFDGKYVGPVLRDDKVEYIDGGNGADVIYGGDGSDFIDARGDKQPRQPDKLYCGKGKDQYDADPMDYVDSSCEKKAMWGPPIF